MRFALEKHNKNNDLYQHLVIEKENKTARKRAREHVIVQLMTVIYRHNKDIIIVKYSIIYYTKNQLQ